MASQNSHAEAEREVAIRVTKIGQKSVRRTRRGRYRRRSGSELMELMLSLSSRRMEEISLWAEALPPGERGGLRSNSRR